MRDYELIFIIHPDLDDTATSEIVEKVNGWITGDGGVIVKTELWGKRKLAYAIRKQKEGQYVFIKMQMKNTTGVILERNLRVTEPILRSLITVAE